MKLASVMGRVLSVLTALVLLPGTAAACCTAVLCPSCVSSSGSCICGSEIPVCNVFGCNCNDQCGAYAAGTNLRCYFSSPCDSADARARFSEVDGDKDGAISKDEAWIWAQKQKNPLKVNESDLPEDLRSASASQQDIAGAGFTLADADKDGSISPAEFDSSLGAAQK